MAALVPDGALVEAVRSGDLTAFETLYLRHAPAVRSVLVHKLRRPDLLDDAVQDVFLRALESLGALRDPSAVLPWLKAIARNVAGDRFRQPQTDEVPDDDELADGGPDLAEVVEVRELARLVQGTITGLSPRDTEAVILAGYHAAGPAEIAERLGVSVGAAKVLLHRARRRLRLALKLELLVRRRSSGCATFDGLLAGDELVTASRHLAGCRVCQRAGSREIRGIAAEHPEPVDVAPPPRRARPLVAGPRVEVRSGGARRVVPLGRRLVVGRECDGVDPAEALLLDDDAVSRRHAELHATGDGGFRLVDLSRNGTRRNGTRVEPNHPVALADGDVLELGPAELVVHLPDPVGDRPAPAADVRSATTVRHAVAGPAAMVVGDIVGFTSIAEAVDSTRLAVAVDELFSTLTSLLRLSGGALANIAGDAVFGVWDLRDHDDAARRAVAFAVAAHRLVEGFEPSPPLPDGVRLRMGWAAGYGTVAMPGVAGRGVNVVGDAANVVFRVASAAHRDGAPAVLVTEELAAIDPDGDRGRRLELQVKGRERVVVVHEALG